MDYLKVSIIVVCYNEEKHIRSCLQSIFSIDYPLDCYEVIVVDGNSNDSTSDIVNEFVAQYDNLNLIVNPKRTIASNRNLGVVNARYDYIIFTDADCTVPANWVRTLTGSYLRLKKQVCGLAAVGGANIAANTNFFSQCISQVMNSYLSCMGSVQGKKYENEKSVDSLACLNVLYEKQKLIEVGLFDETLKNITEDYELNHRLREHNYKLFYVPYCEVLHDLRGTPVAFAKQMYNYGKGRGLLLKYKPKTIKLIYVIPIGFLTANFSMLLVPLSIIFCIPLISYFFVITANAFYKAIKMKTFKLFFGCFAVFLIIHYSYSIGELVGIIAKRR